MKWRWPRGRYNGDRIVGFRVTVVLDVTRWMLCWGNILYGSCWAVGPVRVWVAHEFRADPVRVREERRRVD